MSERKKKSFKKRSDQARDTIQVFFSHQRDTDANAANTLCKESKVKRVTYNDEALEEKKQTTKKNHL